MRVSTNFKLTPKMYKLATLFEEAGYEFYFVGGFVRDTLMITSSHDVDATTNARPDEIKRVLREGFADEIEAMYTIGEKYGTIGFKVWGAEVEITTYRTEQYTDGSRKPEVVFGHTLEEDLSRRDFTINAIACDKDANIIDPFDGLEDIKDDTLKFVGNPLERIAEDPLRLLRAVRFASRYGFKFDTKTYINIVQMREAIGEISKERIRDELIKMLKQDNPSVAVRLLQSTLLLRQILPEISTLRGVPQVSPYHFENAFDHTMRVLDNSPALIEQRLAALLHDTGKAETVEYTEEGNTTFYGHEEESAKIAHRVLHRLRFPHRIVNDVTHLVACHMRPLQLYNELDAKRLPSKRAIRRFIHKCYLHGRCNVYDVMLLNYADMAGHANPVMENWHALQELVSRERDNMNNLPEQAHSPLDGNELMELFDNKPGPGPWIGATKEHLTNLVIDAIIEIDDKESARREALKFWNHTK